LQDALWFFNRLDKDGNHQIDYNEFVSKPLDEIFDFDKMSDIDAKELKPASRNSVLRRAAATKAAAAGRNIIMDPPETPELKGRRHNPAVDDITVPHVSMVT
jgi:hypothetical protein